MLTAIALVLAVMWILGLVTNYTLGGFIHLLMIFALVLFLARIVTGRRVMS